MNKRLRQLNFLALMYAFILASCSTSREGEAHIVGVMGQGLSAESVTEVVLTVSAPDMVMPRTERLARSGNQWGGVLGGLPAGRDRRFQVEARDSQGQVLFRGEAPGVVLEPGQRLSLFITLHEANPPPPYQNTAPRISSLIASASWVEPGGALSLSATVEELDAGDTWSARWTGTAGTFSSPMQAATRWTAPTTPGMVTLTFTVRDSQGATATVSLDIGVQTSATEADVQVAFNSWPRVNHITASSTSVLPGETTQVSTVASDADGDALSYQWNSNCAGRWLHSNSRDAWFTPSKPPSSEECSPCRLSVTVTDGRGGQASGSFSLCVGPGPRPRFAPEITERFHSNTCVPASGVTVSIAAVDEQGGPLSFSWRSSAGSVSGQTNTTSTSQVLWTLPTTVNEGKLTVTVSNTLGLSTSTAFTLPRCYWRDVAVGFHHALALRSDGTVWAWGSNEHGQLGIGSQVHQPVPVRVPGLIQMKAVAAGAHHSLAVDGSGALWVWGANWSGQLGSGSYVSSRIPIALTVSSPMRSVAAGASHSLAVGEDGTLWSWGDNSMGQLGDGTFQPRIQPGRVPSLTNITSVATLHHHSLALDGSKRVWAWGSNSNGEVGDGTANTRATPFLIANLVNVRTIAAGGMHSLALLEDGTVQFWGDNSYGQFDGKSTITDYLLPVPIPTLTEVEGIATNIINSVVRRRDGTVWTWGPNWQGQTGQGNDYTPGCDSPCIVRNLTGASLLRASGHQLMALVGADTLFAWGDNNFGQLGNGVMGQGDTPTRAAIDPVSHIAVGGHTSYALRGGGLWAWGANWHANFGDSSSIHNPVPRLTNSDLSLTQISAGIHHLLALDNTRTLWSMGGDWCGQRGDGPDAHWTEPSKVLLPPEVTHISAGPAYSLARLEDRTVWVWGCEGYLGNGAESFLATPVQVQGLQAIVELSAGGRHALARDANGVVWSWGDNTHGQLGDGTIQRNHIPRPVGGLPRIRSIAAGGNHSMALDENFFVWVWGHNTHGQLGNEGGEQQLTPARLMSLKNVMAISAGANHSVAQLHDNSIYTWGHAAFGQVGKEPSSSRRSPVRVGNFTRVTSSSASNFTLALDDSSQVWVWGDNGLGQHGTGVRGYVSTPGRVLLP